MSPGVVLTAGQPEKYSEVAGMVASGGGGYRQQREMYPAVCATCGKNTQVPFEPRNGRPVYCSDCYSKSRR